MFHVCLQCSVSVRDFWDEKKYPMVLYDMCILCLVYYRQSTLTLTLILTLTQTLTLTLTLTQTLTLTLTRTLLS